MQKIFFAKSAPESPFFDLLADAQEVKIREVTPETRHKSAQQIAKGDASKSEWMRSFLVHVKTPLAGTPGQSVVSMPETAEDRDYLLKSAELLLQSGDVLLARNLFSYLLRRYPNDPLAMQGLGTCFMRLGEKTAARKCFQALLDVKKSDQILLNLALCLSAEGDDLGAIHSLKQIENPAELGKEEQFQYYKQLGNCYQRLERYDEAEQCYSHALRLFPDKDCTYVNLGMLQLQRGDLLKSREYFHKALEICPTNAKAQTGLGLISLSHTNPSEAIRYFRSALDIDSQNTIALFQLVQLSALHGDAAEAKNRIQRYLEKDPKNPEVRFALAVLLYKQGDWWECELEIQRILERHPTHTKAKALKEELLGNRYRV